jgi:hypothetical protein
MAPLPNCLQSLSWRTCLENTDAHQWRANPNPMREPGGVVQKSCNALPLKTTRPERSCPSEWWLTALVAVLSGVAGMISAPRVAG